MSYSSAEINRISGSRLAVQGRKYIEQNGDVWIGTKENRLKRVYLKDTQIGVELYSDEPTVSLKTYLRTLTDNDTLTQEFMDSYGKIVQDLETIAKQIKALTSANL